VPYQEATLIGDEHTPEALVINLAGVDCFTFIDYVEAMRRSESFSAFRENLRKVRYRGGVVGYTQRNHFFTDWIAANAGFIDDVTGQIGAGKLKKVTKKLNAADSGGQLLPGIDVRKRELYYIPVSVIDTGVLARLRTGDYLGIYAVQEDLDVSHVGIVIQKSSGTVFRHASSQKRHRRVVDEDLAGYLVRKPGIIVLRPRAIGQR